MSIKSKMKDNFEQTKFVSDYFKLIKNNLAVLMGAEYDDMEIIREALEITDNNLGVDTKKYLMGDFPTFTGTTEPDVIKSSNINSSYIGRLVGQSAQFINKLLVEKGFVVKTTEGYTVTDKGAAHGGRTTSTFRGRGQTSVLWDDRIIDALGIDL